MAVSSLQQQQQQQSQPFINVVFGSSITNGYQPPDTSYVEIEGKKGTFSDNSYPTKTFSNGVDDDTGGEGHPLFQSPMVTSQSILHTLYFILIIIGGIFIIWALKKFLQWFFRDISRFEIWVAEERIEKRLDRFHTQLSKTQTIHTITPTNAETNSNNNHKPKIHPYQQQHARNKQHNDNLSKYTTVVPLYTGLGDKYSSKSKKSSSFFTGNNKRSQEYTTTTTSIRVRHTTLHYFRANFVLLFYAVLQIIIIFGTIVTGLWIIQYDVFAIITSLGIITFVSLFHLGDFFRNFFAYFWILGSYQLQRGDLISVSGLGIHGCVIEFTSTHVLLRCVGKMSSLHPCVGKWDQYIPNSYFLITPFRIYDEMKNDYEEDYNIHCT